MDSAAAGRDAHKAHFKRTPQLLYQKREEAIRSAKGFAAAQGVSAWYTDDGKTHQRIDSGNR